MKRIFSLSALILAFGVTAVGLFSCEQQSVVKTDSVTVTKPKPANKKPKLYPVVVEVIMKPNEVKRLSDILADTKFFSDVDANINIWKNHISIFANVPDAIDFADYIKEHWRNTYDSVKVYDKPIYNFNRQMCADTITSKDWTNIVLTANLVADPKLQQEYLDYHKTQFEKWPEVSKGFCNAQFQQLLVFRNGRQLMLVISIPKGKTLDELNPLTTKDNPRVDEWNKIMSKYQEGIPGTKKGETWVFLKEVASLQ